MVCELIVGFARKRNDGLAGNLRVRRPGLRSLRFARIDWWKIFRRLIVNYLRVIECRLGDYLRLHREEAGQSNQ